MNTEWLTAEVLSEINVDFRDKYPLHLYQKLAREGVFEVPEIGNVDAAKQELREFWPR